MMTFHLPLSKTNGKSTICELGFANVFVFWSKVKYSDSYFVDNQSVVLFGIVTKKMSHVFKIKLQK